MNEYSKAFLLSLVEGLTEFIPVSSTGHMIIVGDAIGFTGERANTFEVFIQLGAILAVLMLYGHRFLAIIPTSISDLIPRENQGFRGGSGAWKLALGSLPALIAGALFHSQIKALLFFPHPVAYALIAGGFAMIFVEIVLGDRTIHSIDNVTTLQFFLIGLCQCLALWPGISRAAATIVAALLLGCNRVVAAEVSFFLAVPVIAAASVFDLLKNLDHLYATDVPLFLIGFVGAFVTAIVAIKTFIAILGRVSLAPFGMYRILLGAYVILTFANN